MFYTFLFVLAALFRYRGHHPCDQTICNGYPHHRVAKENRNKRLNGSDRSVHIQQNKGCEEQCVGIKRFFRLKVDGVFHGISIDKDIASKQKTPPPRGSLTIRMDSVVRWTG